MIKNNNKFRINHVPSRQAIPSKPEAHSFSALLGRVVQAVKEKAANAYSKLESKLTDTPAVFSVGKDDRQKELSVQQMPRDRDSTLSKNSQALKGRARSNLTREDGQKLKQLINRKQELMEKLRKIDYELLNPVTVELGLSRASAQSPLKQLQSRLKVQQSRVYNAGQHQKTIEMLSRLNNEKIKRQERIVHDMKRKQEQEIKKLNQIENKSQLMLSRRRNHTPTPLIKFNTKETENPPFDRRTNSVADSNPKTTEKVENQFDELPELITSEKPCFEPQPTEQQTV